ncbi:MAG: hypothetical protein LBH45_04510 [Campylobacteraceae bacterium]|jgi:hypothetical protein|nr:hypothetical protein [Campylobacteraceae bacterium]
MEILEKQNDFKTPILLLVFNRLDTTIKVFNEIKKIQPKKFYIACDGPRENKKNELSKVKEVREYILKNIDWDCEIKTLFRDENLGCKYSISDAITWFFNNEEQGIILEDDCLPNKSFFAFCEKMLEKYKNNLKIGHIGGSNFQKNIKRGDADYYFSAYSHVWGWASWANRWIKYNVELDNIDNDKFLYKYFKNKNAIKYWSHIFKAMKDKKIDTWDYQWTFTLWNNNQISIIPNKNLISNIGFGDGATHTKFKHDPFANMPTFELTIKKHPLTIQRDDVADNFTFKKCYTLSIWIKIIKKFYK